ncbi:MAG: redox-sensing transcriptional repressor Rex [Acidimicrobiia bacterium]|nr:redox-sensing transcriptional repressor Rex [Acidimicrobiia bacterium]
MKGIPPATVQRLPIYLRCLTEYGEPTISSERLAELARVNSAKVRKDLSFLGSYGTRGVGYDVDHLVHQVGRELGLTEDWAVCIVGMGNLGSALAQYGGFGQRGFEVLGLFDSDPAKVGKKVGGLVIEPLTKFARAVKSRRLSIGVITTPATGAQEVADRMVEAGITSILNFAPIVLSVPDGIDVRRVDLSTELQICSFYLSRSSGKRAS